MNSDIEQLKKKIIYRSNYRGTKEMDKLLGAFTNAYINQLNERDLLDLQKLLSFEDEDLFNFYKGLNTNIEFEENNVNTLFTFSLEPNKSKYSILSLSSGKFLIPIEINLCPNPAIL